jgi:hypothetical protein
MEVTPAPAATAAKSGPGARAIAAYMAIGAIIVIAVATKSEALAVCYTELGG